jgi:hypothetical protein
VKGFGDHTRCMRPDREEQTMVRLGLGLMIVEVLIVVAAAQVVEIVPNTPSTVGGVALGFGEGPPDVEVVPNTSSTVNGVILGLDDTPQAGGFTPAPPQGMRQPGAFAQEFGAVFDRLLQSGGALTDADRAALADLERRLRGEAPGESAELWNLVARLNAGADQVATRLRNALAAERQRYYRELSGLDVAWRSARTGR